MKLHKYRLLFLVFLAYFFLPYVSSAHPMVGVDPGTLSPWQASLLYLKLGFVHIIPLGFDHILFITGIFLLKPKLSSIMWQATAFTVAHSVTLGLAMYGVISPKSSVIEPLIALSIAFIAIENIVVNSINVWRIVVVFLFGLIHGLGFASVLSEFGLPSALFIPSLISFNVGVELGQFTIIFAAYFLVIKWVKKKEWYKNRIVIPSSSLIALIAIYWTVQRIFF